MVIMNDRPQGGSAYSQGRVELMFHRYGVSQDELGLWEPMKDLAEDGKGVNVSAKWYLAYTKSREEAYKLIL